MTYENIIYALLTTAALRSFIGAVDAIKYAIAYLSYSYALSGMAVVLSARTSCKRSL